MTAPSTLDAMLREAEAEDAQVVLGFNCYGGDPWGAGVRFSEQKDGAWFAGVGPTPEAALSAALAAWKERSGG